MTFKDLPKGVRSVTVQELRNEISQQNAEMMSYFISELMHKFENSGKSAEDFFDEEESEVCTYSNTLAYIVNYVGCTLYGTLPMQNNPFLEN